MSQRYCFRSDGDGHHFLIPVELTEEFEKWREWSEDYWNGEGDYEDKQDWQGTDFDQYMTPFHLGSYTFTDPQPPK